MRRPKVCPGLADKLGPIYGPSLQVMSQEGILIAHLACGVSK